MEGPQEIKPGKQVLCIFCCRGSWCNPHFSALVVTVLSRTLLFGTCGTQPNLVPFAKTIHCAEMQLLKARHAIQSKQAQRRKPLMFGFGFARVSPKDIAWCCGSQPGIHSGRNDGSGHRNM